MKIIFFSRLLTIALLFQACCIQAQNFVRITDPNHPVVQDQLDDYWTGATWVDVDNDDDLDLFLTNRTPGTSPRRNKLFANESGSFSQIDTGTLVNDFGFWFGCSWGDYDNDGDLDVHVAGLPSRLYRNEGNFAFTEITTGNISLNSLSGISTAWGDLNNDGYLDLVTIWPEWLSGPPQVGNPGPPHIMVNDGPPNFDFTRLLNTPITAVNQDTYLHPTLSDFDEDGDLDLFFGMGSGASKPDLLYRNLWSESGTLDFEQIEEPPLATDLVEGNQWSFADIDNDGDLDAYLTNWAISSGNTFTPKANNLYRNEAGTFVPITDDVIATDADLSSTNTWGDFDNDADLDCIVVTDSTYLLKFYQNDGTGHFTRIDAGMLGLTDLHQSGASAGDFDNDGDLDLYIPGPFGDDALFRNDLENENNWVRFKLIGTTSNHAGIGSKVRIKTSLNGNTLWQMREVSASDVFFGHNSLWVHFGLGEAEVVDSLVIEWPSGTLDAYDQIGGNIFYELTEGESVFPNQSSQAIKTLNHFVAYPSPSSGIIYIELLLSQNDSLSLVLTDIEGNAIFSENIRVQKDILWKKPIYLNTVRTAGSGIYFLSVLKDGALFSTQKIILKE